MGEFNVSCPVCQRAFCVAEKYDGQGVQCPACNKSFTAQSGAPKTQEQKRHDELSKKITLDAYQILNWLGNALIVLGVLATVGGVVIIIGFHINYPGYGWGSSGLWTMFCGVGFLVDAAIIKLLCVIARNIELSTALKERELKNRE